MKIVELKTIVIENIKPYRGGTKWLFIQLVTDQGIVGLGERPTAHATNLAPQITLFHELADAFLIGENPFNIEKLWQNIYSTLHDSRAASYVYTPELSAIVMGS